MPNRRYQNTAGKKTRRRSSRKNTQHKLKQIMLLSLLVLGILVADAYRRGNVKLYQGKHTAKEDTVSKAKDRTETGKPSDKPVESKQTSGDQKQIRVLLSTTDFGSLFHDQVKLKGTKAVTVTQGKQKQQYPAGKEIVFKAGQKYSDTVHVEVETGGKLKLCSVTRQDRHPSYRGKMEIKQTKQGFTVINELTLREYLYAVVPSELSTGNKMEALKAQAVCARTYAYNQLQSDRFDEYGADLDDSTASQVYNNIPEDKRSRKAVNSTAGEVVVRGDDLVTTYYYSTSWGKSASGKEVWDTASEVSYLKSCMQTEGQEDGASRDLSTDAAFRKFLTGDTAVTYDREADWYRWQVTISAASLAKRIDAALQSCYQTDASRILTQDKTGEYHQKALKPMGEIQKIRVEKRGKSGLVTELVIVGSENVVKVCSQYNVRKVLSPGEADIYYGAGKTQMSLLPSAAFYLDGVTDRKGNLVFEIHGGGCGHGTGMSQCGASQMAKQGKQYKEILQYYFSGCDVVEKSIIK